MISDSERREVAAKLRSVETCYFDDCDLCDCGEAEDAIGLRRDDDPAWYTADSVYRLADLIDRPTTRVGINEHGRAYCECCGCDDWCLAYGAKFCPHCGAEVVE